MLTKRKKGKTQITNIKNEEITTTDPIDTKKIRKEYYRY